MENALFVFERELAKRYEHNVSHIVRNASTRPREFDEILRTEHIGATLQLEVGIWPPEHFSHPWCLTARRVLEKGNLRRKAKEGEAQQEPRLPVQHGGQVVYKY